MIAPTLGMMNVIIVDPQPNDYSELLPVAERRKSRVDFFTTGDAALRNAKAKPRTCWLINLRLPDMSGLDLYELLRNRTAGASVFLVADEYDAEAEISVLRTGTAQFACKPLHPSWVAETVPYDDQRPVKTRRYVEPVPEIPEDLGLKKG